MKDGVKALYRIIDWGDDLQARAQEELAALPDTALPEGWVTGKAFVFVMEGRVYCRYYGHQRGLDVTPEDIDSALKAFQCGDTTCAIDYEHDEDRPIGTVLAMWKVERGGKVGIAALPAYSPEGVEIIRNAAYLWSSPHIQWATVQSQKIYPDGSEGPIEHRRKDYVTADTGEPIGPMMIPHLALCKDPAQSHRVLTPVRLSQARMASDTAPISTPEVTANSELEDEGMEELQAAIAELQAALAAQGEAIAALGARIDAMEPKAEEAPAEAEEEMQDKEPMAAELSALQAEVEKLKAEKVAVENASAVRELLASGRITPAEQAAAERVVAAGGRELLASVYGARAEGQAIPQLKGHSKAVDEQPETAHKAIQAFLGSDAGKGHTYLTAAAHIETIRPELFGAK